MVVPYDLPGLALWMKADSITGKANGEAVDTWVDSSPSAHVFTQPTATKRPLFVANALSSGKPALVFDGTDDSLPFPASALSIARNVPAFSCIAVTSMNWSSSSYTKQIVHVSRSGSTVQNRFALARNGVSPAGAFRDETYRLAGRRLDTDSIAEEYTTTGSASNGTLQIVNGEIDYADSAARVWIDGALNVENLTFLTNGNTSNTNSNSGQIGCRADGTAEFWAGNILEILLFNTKVSTDTKTKAESYLSAKYNIPVTGFDPNWAGVPAGEDWKFSAGGVLTPLTSLGIVQDGVLKPFRYTAG